MPSTSLVKIAAGAVPRRQASSKMLLGAAGTATARQREDAPGHVGATLRMSLVDDGTALGLNAAPEAQRFCQQQQSARRCAGGARCGPEWMATSPLPKRFVAPDPGPSCAERTHFRQVAKRPRPGRYCRAYSARIWPNSSSARPSGRAGAALPPRRYPPPGGHPASCSGASQPRFCKTANTMRLVQTMKSTEGCVGYCSSNGRKAANSSREKMRAAQGNHIELRRFNGREAVARGP